MYRVLVAVALLVSVAGCNTAFRRAVSRAEAADAAGDLPGAAAAWREACRLDPGDDDACARAQGAARAFAAAAIAAAAPACAAGDPDGCARSIRPAYDVAPEDPEVARLLDEAGRLHAERCPAAPAGEVAAAIARLDCLDFWAEAVPTPAYRERLSGEARGLAALLVSRVRGGAGTASPAAAHALLDAAACLDPAHRPAAAEARAAFLRRGLPLELVVRVRPGSAPVPGAGALCEQVRVAVPVLTCGGAGEPLRFDLELALSPERYSLSETEHVARRRVGTRQVPNPEWERVAEENRLAGQHLVAAENRARRLREICDEGRMRLLGDRRSEAGLDHNCRRADEAERELWRREREADAARSRLDACPPTLAEEIYRTVPYRERLHRWVADFSARLIGPDGTAAELVPPGGLLVHEDLERIAIPDLGIAGDPLEELPPGRFVALAAEAIRGPLVERAAAAVAARGQARARDCDRAGAPWSDPWLACRAEAAAWQGRAVAGELLRAPGAEAPIRCRE